MTELLTKDKNFIHWAPLIRSQASKVALNYPTPNFSLNFSVYSRLVKRLHSNLELKHCELYELVLFECFPFLPASNRRFCMDKASVDHSTPRFLRNPKLNLGNCLQQMIGLPYIYSEADINCRYGEGLLSLT